MSSLTDNDNTMLFAKAAIASNLECWEWDILMNTVNAPFLSSDEKNLPLEKFLCVVHPDDRNNVRKNLLAAIKTGVYYDNGFRRMHENGLLEWYIGRGKILLTEDAQKLFGIWINIKNKEEEFREISQRVARLALTAQLCSLREFVSIVAHELSQPLMVISTYLSGCIRRIESGQYAINDIIGAMKTANMNVELAGSLIHRLKNSIRKTEMSYVKVNINDLIQRAASLINTESDYPPFEIYYELSPTLPLIEVDTTKIKLVILSLLNNGIEAAYEANVKKSILHVSTGIVDDRYIVISIKDNGGGISSAIEGDLFNSCTTTKPKGIGMGLATCRGIIDDHKGSITYYSPPEGGSCFKVKLPIQSCS